MNFARLNAVRELTTYDLVKTLAIVLMLVDHIGYFFYPDELWFRVIGRACLPIWFFLIGYANSRDVGPAMWIGAIIVGIGSITLGGSVFALNILFTMLIIRFVIDQVAARMFSHWTWLVGGFAVMIAVYMPSAMLIEYGTSGLLLALFGYAMRHEDELQMPRWMLYVFSALTLVFFAGSQIYLFGRMDPNFGEAESKVTLILVGLSGLMMTCFRPLALTRLTEVLPRFVTVGVQITGRFTMEIYVIHLILFRLASLMLDNPRHLFMNIHWFN